MKEVLHELTGSSPGTRRFWSSLHYGAGRSGRKVFIQCALHADEIPGLIVGVHLRGLLAALEAQGAIEGEIVLVPMANPVGLSQGVLGSAVGRFELSSGQNFNRGYRYLTPGLMEALQGRLGADAQANTRLIRAEALRLLEQWQPASEIESLQRGLQRLAIDADVVLDLHSDSEALIHLYAPTPHEGLARALAECLGATPVLLAMESGDDPFDESVSRHWWELQAAWEGRAPVELACFSTTIELRGERNVDHATAAADAQGLLRFLVITGDLPAASVQAAVGRGLGAGGEAAAAMPSGLDKAAGAQALRVTALEAVDPVITPVGGILVMARRLGDSIETGAVIAEVIDPSTGRSTPLKAATTGLLFAHTDRRWVQAGQRVAKVAGDRAIRSGKLLSP